MPRMDKIQSISNWLNIELSDLLEDKTEQQETGYYVSADTRKIAQEIFDSEELRMLFDATRGVGKDDLKLVYEMLKRMKKEE